MTDTSQAKVFISHRSTDKTVANALCDLIQSSFKIDSQDIICTSADAHGIENGTPAYEELKKKLSNAKCVIFLLSKEFCQSEDCLYEIAWGFDLNTVFYFHLDGVASKFKPKCTVSQSMCNMNRVDLTKLKLRLERSLSLTVDDVKWTEKVEGLMKAYEDNRQSKAQDSKLTDPGVNNWSSIENSEEETIADKIDRFNNHTSAVYILAELVQTSAGKKYKNDLVYLPDNEAKNLIDAKKAGNSCLRVYAYQVIQEFEDIVHGRVQPGDILPFYESYIKSREGTYVIRLRSERDVIDVKNLDTDAQLHGCVQPWTMTAVSHQWGMPPLMTPHRRGF